MSDDLGSPSHPFPDNSEYPGKFPDVIARDLIALLKEKGEKLEKQHTVTWNLGSFTYVEHDDGKVQFNHLMWKGYVLYTE